MRVIVTGASGFLGRAIIDKICRQNPDISITAIVRKESDASGIDEKADILYASFDDIDSLADSFNREEKKIMYHFAWQGVNGEDKRNIDVQLSNIEMAMKYIRLAKKINCDKILMAGTVAENAIESIENVSTVGAAMFYAAAKTSTRMMAEVLSKSLGLSIVWMQIANVYGADNNTGNLISYTLKQLDKNQNADFGPAKQPYDFIHIDDLTEAMYRIGIMHTSESFYYIGSGKPRILQEYLRYIGEVYGKPELIRIGTRDDDGIKYRLDMFNIQPLINDIGDYAKRDFECEVKAMIERGIR